MTELFFSIGDLFQSIFQYIKKIGAKPNIIFIIVYFIILIFWLSKILNFGQDDKKL